MGLGLLRRERRESQHGRLVLPPSTVFASRGAVLAVFFVLMLACGSSNDARASQPRVVADARPDSGRQAIQHYGCAACHVIPGIAGADGRLGPSLDGFANQSIIAGHLANTPANLIRWLRDPPAVAPGTAMPDLNIDSTTARDIAAYLYTLR